MATTLPLIETFKTDTRKDGAISWARVRVVLDGAEVNADFRTRLGEEPVVIDGDTIAVSDAQIDAIRRARAFHAQQIADMDARLEAEVAAKLAKIDAALAPKSPSAEATRDIHAYVRANAQVAVSLEAGADKTRFVAGYRQLLASHGLI